jgi:WD40 repeat protein
VKLGDGRLLHVQGAQVSALAFSPDGQILAVGNDDGTVRLFSVPSGKVEGSWLIGHTGQITSVQFSPNGQLISSTATDDTTRLFDVVARRPYGSPFPSTGAGARPFAADSNHLFNATAAGVVSYDLDPATWVERACDLAGGNISRQGWNLYLPGRTPVATCPQYPPPS